MARGKECNMKMRKTALLLALVCLLSACANPSVNVENPETVDSGANTGATTPPETEAAKLAAVQYPEAVPYPTQVEYDKSGHLDYDAYEAAMDKWFDTWTERREGTDNNLSDLAAYYRTASPVFLKAALKEQKNAVCSPLNIYMALAMLAETTAGTSRQQVLDLLGTDSTDSLRTTIGNLWRANYEEDEVVTCMLANSVWLSSARSYKQELLDRLAADYFAESFAGRMGSEAYNKLLQDWLNEKTQGLLQDAVKGIKMDPHTVLALASTLYYKASWEEAFMKNATGQETFHGVDGDETVDMMHRTAWFPYYAGEDFRAASIPLKESGSMWVILPEEGQNAEALLENDAMWELLCGQAEDEIDSARLAVSMPRFDVNAHMSLMDGLRELGMTDVMDDMASDFSPLCDNAEGIILSEATHAARVMADEEGVIGAAFTVLMAKATAAFREDEPIPFVVDKPYLFCVTARDGSLLFMGIVNTLQK